MTETSGDKAERRSGEYGEYGEYRSYEQVFSDVGERIRADFPATAAFPEIMERLRVEMANAEWKMQCAYNHDTVTPDSCKDGILAIYWYEAQNNGKGSTGARKDGQRDRPDIPITRDGAPIGRDFIVTTITRKEARELAHQILYAIGDPVPLRVSDTGDVYTAGMVTASQTGMVSPDPSGLLYSFSDPPVKIVDAPSGMRPGYQGDIEVDTRQKLSRAEAEDLLASAEADDSGGGICRGAGLSGAEKDADAGQHSMSLSESVQARVTRDREDRATLAQRRQLARIEGRPEPRY
jgi:hypothetical protein